MTWDDIMAADLALQFATGGFGVESVTYTPAATGSVAATFNAMFDVGEDLSQSGRNDALRAVATLTVRASDVADPAYRDTVVAREKTYRVLSVGRSDGLTWTLNLYSDERPVMR